MSKYTKTSSAKYLKSLRNAYPTGSKNTTRNPAFFSDSTFNKFEFKAVLPMMLKNSISGKGSNVKPSYECVEPMNNMINCLMLSDYNEAHCAPEVTSFLACFNKFNVDTKSALERADAGIVDTDKNIRKFPRKFVLKMLDQYKHPRKVDNGPAMP